MATLQTSDEDPQDVYQARQVWQSLEGQATLRALEDHEQHPGDVKVMRDEPDPGTGGIKGMLKQTGESAARGAAMTPLLGGDFLVDTLDFGTRAVADALRPVIGDEVPDMMTSGAQEMQAYWEPRFQQTLEMAKGEDEGMGYDLLRDSVPFLITGMSAATKLAATVIGKSAVGTGMASGAVADFTMMQPEEGNLASAFADQGMLHEYLMFLSSKEYDENMAGRLISTGEGAVIGETLAQTFKGLGKVGRGMLKYVREVNRASMHKVEMEALHELFTPNLSLPSVDNKYQQALVRLTKARIGRGQGINGYIIDMQRRGFDVRDAIDMYVDTYNSMFTPSKAVGKQAGMVAFHGTPHQFDKFTLAHIGSGEGAQAYGWGLYFAGDQSIARYYKETLATAKGALEIDGRGLHNLPPLAAKARDVVGHINGYTVGGMGMDDAIAEARKTYWGTKKEFDSVVKEIGHRLSPATGGSVKQVDIPEDTDLLDYDAPLSEQPESISGLLADGGVRAALQLDSKEMHLVNDLGDELHWSELFDDASEMTPKMMAKTAKITGGNARWVEYGDLQNGRVTGADLYAAMTKKLGSDKAASEFLLEAGIPGLRYFDGNSRNRPLKDIKKQFLEALPEDAEVDDIMDMLDAGEFSPEVAPVLKMLADEDWLGFDYPAQAISAAFGKNIGNFDVSPELVKAVNSLRSGHHNYVIWDEEAIKTLGDIE